jgi:hypothetical protein
MAKIKLDEKEYDIRTSDTKALNMLQQIRLLDDRIKEASNMMSVLTKAKRAYISDLKSEMIAAKAGLDLGL